MTKEQLSDLAILGGTPAFDQTLHVGRPNIGDRQRLLERLEDGPRLSFLFYLLCLLE